MSFLDKIKEMQSQQQEGGEVKPQNNPLKNNPLKSNPLKENPLKSNPLKNKTVNPFAKENDKKPKKDEVKEQEVKKDEVKEQEVKKDEVKEQEVKKDEVKKEEVKKEESKKEEVKKEEPKKEEVKKEEPKKEESKKEESKKEEVKKETHKKENKKNKKNKEEPKKEIEEDAKDILDEEPIEKIEDFTEAINSIKSTYVDLKWEEYKNEIEHELNEIKIEPDINTEQFKILISKLDNLRNKTWKEFLHYKTEYELLVSDKPEGLMERVKKTAFTNSDKNAEDRKKRGIISCMNYKVKTEKGEFKNINLYELYDELKRRFEFLNQVMRSIQFKSDSFIKINGILKLEPKTPNLDEE